MKQILGNLKNYWYLVITILALLVFQAYCDLSLPSYTSDIIDVGIANSGVEHAVPEVLSEEGYNGLALFLTDEEKQELEDAYTFDLEKGYYRLNSTDEDYWNILDEEFGKVMAVIYMMTAKQDTSVEGGNLSWLQDMAAMQNAKSQIPEISEEQMASMSEEQLMQYSQMAMPQMSEEQMKQMQEAGKALEELGVDINSETLLLDIRGVFEEKMSSLGDSMIRSMAKGFAKNEYISCGIDMEKLQSDYMWRIGGKMLMMAFFMALAAVLIGFLASRVAAGVGRDLRSKVFKKVMSFSNAEMDKFSTASLITRSTNDVQQIQIVTVLMLRMVLYSPVLAIGGIVNVVQYKAGMSWIIIIAIAAVACLMAFLLFVAMPEFKLMQTLVDHVNLVAREILTGLPVIRAFSRAQREEERFDEANTNLTKVMLFVNRTMSMMMPALMLIMNGVSVLIVWVAAHKIDEGTLEVGAMTAFITYAMLIIMSFLMLTMLSVILPRAAVAAERIQDVLDTPVSLKEKADAVTTAPEDVTIQFEHVDFMYPDSEANALEDIDFIARKGETTAIIGSTGCGKSTLVKLIPRFFDVTNGSISIGGRDIREYSIDTLRKMIGYVPQKGILFSGDINSNIAYGMDTADREQIEEAASIAQASDFITEKNLGYESPISQGGTNVSGGQKQRLSIARAIARNPKIYIFDDSFSALDFKTDTALRKALAKKTQDAAVIIVAQRVSTILNADQIIVLEDGKMIGKGTHKELVKNCETYKQIAQSQLSEAEFLRSIDGKEDK